MQRDPFHWSVRPGYVLLYRGSEEMARIHKDQIPQLMLDLARALRDGADT